ncbi:MAG TPA: hypothetical protein PLD02_14630 [Saprospiraceae bacterium]|nr:hypothetical protein [Saprospiraceae bacterium]
MKEYEIWVEGYADSGNREQASLLAKQKGISWIDAVSRYMEKNPGRIRIDDRGFTDWGCRLFDNEADARKSFG